MDFVLIEIGGTVGEYQNILFLEAIRIMKLKNPENIVLGFVSYFPILKATGEMKTKPTQTAVRTLNATGIHPDFIFCRSSLPLDSVRKNKISISCNIPSKNVISAPDVDSIYEILINFEKENLGNKILKKFGLKEKNGNLKEWEDLVKIIKTEEKLVKIAIIGKYFETGKFILMDSYISVIEAIKHASWGLKRNPEISWLSAEEFENPTKNLDKKLKEFDGIIVPGGFGTRGVEGKIKVIEYCRINKIPFLGLCLGMQLAVIEFARNVCNIKDASSAEFQLSSDNLVIDTMLEQKNLLKNNKYGGTMRLGAFNCKIKKNTKTYECYKKEIISERHRHRYELNNKFKEKLEENGLNITGINPEKNLVEIIEISSHPFFIATQFHPEFKSRPLNPHRLFTGFIKASIKN